MSRQRTLTLLGSMSVGKTALSRSYSKGEFSEKYNPTMQDTYQKNETINNIKYNVIIYDTAGLEQQSQIQTKYLESNGFILVYSIDHPQSFEIIRDVFENLREVLNGEYKPILLIGNKTDLADNRRISYEEGKQLAQEMNAEFAETSAISNDEVCAAFHTILKLIDNTEQKQLQEEKEQEEQLRAQQQAQYDRDQQSQQNQQQFNNKYNTNGDNNNIKNKNGNINRGSGGGGGGRNDQTSTNGSNNKNCTIS